VREVRRRGEPTVPSTIGEELATNPFLRWDSPEIRSSIQQRFPDTPSEPSSVFARIRELKDKF
jgi:hydroxyacylglutathione hydrolase